MILTDKDKKKIIVQCDCGREALEFSKWEDTPKMYFVSVLVNAFYTDQDGFFYKMKNRIKTVWHILRHGTHLLQEICLNEEEVKELKEVIKDW